MENLDMTANFVPVAEAVLADVTHVQLQFLFLLSWSWSWKIGVR